MGELCEAFGWRLDLRDMAYFAHWLTPVTRPKRFDTRFFVRLAPADQQAMPDYGEALELMWLTPDEALDPQRGLKLLNVTQRTLHDMRGFASARAAFEHALALRGVALHFPRPALGRNGPRFVIESDAAYDEVARLDPDGPRRREVRAGGRRRDAAVDAAVARGRRSRATPTCCRPGQPTAGSVIDADADDSAAAAGQPSVAVSRCSAARPIQLASASAGRRPANRRRRAVTGVLRLGAGTTLRAAAPARLAARSKRNAC